MVPFPDGFTTKRLVLRPIEAADSGAAFDVYAADPLVTRFLTWTPYVDPGVCANFSRSMLHATRMGKSGLTPSRYGRRDA